MQTQTIRKHWIGYVLIGLIGGLVLVGLTELSLFYVADADPVQWLILLAALVTGIATITLIAVYWLNRIVLSNGGIEYYVYTTPFNRQALATDWSDLQRVESTKAGIIGTLLNFGTLTVITAGGPQSMSMTYIPRPEDVQAVIEGQAA